MIELSAIKFIKENWKAMLFAFLVLTIVILWMLLKSETIRANEAEQGRDAAIKISNDAQALTHLYRNKQGDTVLLTKAIGIPASQVDELLKQNDLKWLKKFEGLKANGKNLQSAETFGLELEAQKIPEKIKWLPCKDSVKSFVYSFKDKWNDINAVVIDTPRIKIKDRIYGVIEMKRPKHWFWKLQWGKFEPVSEITNSNKLIRLDSVEVIVVK